MRIDHLTLKNFRGFESLDLDLHPRCTVLAGVNGSGKSSALEGLAVALGAWFLGFDGIGARPIRREEVRRVRYERERHTDLEPQYPVRVEARGIYPNATVDEEVQDLSLEWARDLRRDGGKTTIGEAGGIIAQAKAAQEGVKQGRDQDLPVLAYYGTGRLWAQKRASKRKKQGLSSRTLGYQDCLDPESNQKLFEAWMKQREQARVQRLSRAAALAAQAAAAAAEPDPALAAFDVSTLAAEAHAMGAAAGDPLLEAVARSAARCVEGGKRFIYDLGNDELRLLFEDDREQSFELLSDGYRGLVALAADIAWRAVRLNPHNGAGAPERAGGVVLIDEVELHLHPAWQRIVLGHLLAAFPRLQFVVTTHSPQILASVAAERVRFLDAVGGVHRVGIAEGLDTNTVLRDLMGVTERPPEIELKLERIAEWIEAGQLERARAQLDKLGSLLGPDDPSITALEWELTEAGSSLTEPEHR